MPTPKRIFSAYVQDDATLDEGDPVVREFFRRFALAGPPPAASEFAQAPIEDEEPAGVASSSASAMAGLYSHAGETIAFGVELPDEAVERPPTVDTIEDAGTKNYLTTIGGKERFGDETLICEHAGRRYVMNVFRNGDPEAKPHKVRGTLENFETAVRQDAMKSFYLVRPTEAEIAEGFDDRFYLGDDERGRRILFAAVPSDRELFMLRVYGDGTLQRSDPIARRVLDSYRPATP